MVILTLVLYDAVLFLHAATAACHGQTAAVMIQSCDTVLLVPHVKGSLTLSP